MTGLIPPMNIVKLIELICKDKHLFGYIQKIFFSEEIG